MTFHQDEIEISSNIRRAVDTICYNIASIETNIQKLCEQVKETNKVLYDGFDMLIKISKAEEKKCS